MIPTDPLSLCFHFHLNHSMQEMSIVKHINQLISPQNIESQSKCLVQLLSDLGVITFPLSPKDESRIKIKRFTEGLSNLVVGVYNQDNPEEIVMVRVYGEATSALVDRKRELDTMVLLSSVGLSNKLYATFDNGFCYEYLNGRVLDSGLVRDERVPKLIAKSFAILHTVQPPNESKDGNIESGLMKQMKKFLHLIPDDLQLELPTMEPEDCNNKESMIKGTELITNGGLITKVQLTKEVSHVERSHLIQTEKDIVLCHNDAVHDNLILSKDESKVLIIDLEYADYNGRAFELANFFMEFRGLNLDTERYPNELFIRKFISDYVTAIEGINLRDKSSHPVPNETELFAKIKMYSCIGNLLWALWALVMSSDPATKSFNFKEYAIKRLADYYRTKTYLL